ncbi:hypothetical protein VAWG006_28120 [Aeromonas enteropelogenes]|nr:hypothetical protein VAWG006_28120 [Aeromonas enteropelogenes]BEE22721.1 hypothetical protein VAWG007_28160 [Aeromonas enteropelogenes]
MAPALATGTRVERGANKWSVYPGEHRFWSWVVEAREASQGIEYKGIFYQAFNQA